MYPRITQIANNNIGLFPLGSLPRNSKQKLQYNITSLNDKYSKNIFFN